MDGYTERVSYWVDTHIGHGSLCLYVSQKIMFFWIKHYNCFILCFVLEYYWVEKYFLKVLNISFTLYLTELLNLQKWKNLLMYLFCLFQFNFNIFLYFFPYKVIVCIFLYKNDGMSVCQFVCNKISCLPLERSCSPLQWSFFLA